LLEIETLARLVGYTSTLAFPKGSYGRLSLLRFSLLTPNLLLKVVFSDLSNRQSKPFDFLMQKLKKSRMLLKVGLSLFSLLISVCHLFLSLSSSSAGSGL
jgi:hypothetical protein